MIFIVSVNCGYIVLYLRICKFRTGMAPTPKSRMSPPEPRMYSRTHPSTTDDEIVISGVSGKFPSCKNVEEFSNNLYNKVSKTDIAGCTELH